MPSLNFQKQFAPKVEDGSKTHTIRLKRKNPIKEGDRLYLFSGLRTKNCRRLKVIDKNWYEDSSVICKSVEEIIIRRPFITINGIKYISYSWYKKFVKADGFNNEEEFFNFFKKTYGNFFQGVLIKW